MGEPIVILALRRKRDWIEGAIANYERKIKEAQAGLAPEERIYRKSASDNSLGQYIGASHSSPRLLG
jgi:hypothetical protein